MRTRYFILAGVLAAGCASAPPDPYGRIWIGALASSTKDEIGTVEVRRGTSYAETRFSIKVHGLPANQPALWRLFTGRCERRDGTVGPVAEIPLLAVDASGVGKANVTLAMRPPEAGEYSVVVTGATGGKMYGCATLKRLGKPGT